MRIHVIGSGPSGMSVAWELLNFTKHEVVIYDKKVDAGGSWWEPSTEYRDLHAHKLAFGSYVNFKSSLKEMGINWDTLFVRNYYDYSFILQNMRLKDYVILGDLYLKAMINPDRYKKISLEDATKNRMSKSGKRVLRAMTHQIDGVGWDTMSVFGLMGSFDHVSLSKQYTQRVSGLVMGQAMKKALIEKGAKFEFNKTLETVEYGDDSYIGAFSDGTEISDGMLVMCIDHEPAVKLIGDNWGATAAKQISESAYGAINVLLDYDQPIKIEDDLYISMHTPWKLYPVVLSDGKTISCTMVTLTEEILKTDPDTFLKEVWKQLKKVGVPKPKNMRFSWGSTWTGEKWRINQSSGVLSVHGQVPYFGKCKKVALCGLMSPRDTPYSSIEGGTEVGRTFCHQTFGTRKALRPLKMSHVLLFTLIILIAYGIRKNRKQ